MGETELPGMQHLARRTRFFAIQRITDDRMPKMMKMNPDLVRASAVQRAFHAAKTAARLQAPILGNRRATFPLVDRHLFALHRMSPDRRVNRAARAFQSAGHKSQVNL